ncbi:MAG: YbfB/YjiJ family MFS transporter [Acetobacteraceae bacterium]|nr:YbfB/YjiJ family MFS transporter [Acetobacteraceae bacterium]
MDQRMAIDNPAAAWNAAIAGLVTLGVAVGIGRFVYTPILPLMVEALGWSRFTAGLVASANFAGYLAGALFAAGKLPGSRRGWLLGALVVSAATTAAMGSVHVVPAFLALRFAGGVASAMALIVASAVVMERLAQAGRAELSSVLFAGVGCGIAVSASLVSGLRVAGTDWGALWWASGGLSLLGAIAVAMLLPGDGPQGAEVRSGRPAGEARGLLPLVVAYGLFGFGYVITATFLVAIVRGSAALRPVEPVVWIVFGLAAVPSIAVWVRVSQGVGLSRGYALACLLEAVGVAVSVAWRSMAGVFLASVLVGGTFMGLTALGLMRGRLFGGSDATRVLAAMTSAFGVGQIVGPSFAGALYDRIGSFGVPSAVAAGALVLAAVLTGGQGRD